MENIDKLKKKRATLRTLITKLIGKLQTLVNNKDIDIDNYLEISEQLNDKEQTLRNLNTEIEAGISLEKEYEIDINTNEEYQEKIIKAKFQIKKQLNPFRHTVPGLGYLILIPNLQMAPGIF